MPTCDATTSFDARFDLRYISNKQRSLLGTFMGRLGELDRLLKFVFGKQLKPVIDPDQSALGKPPLLRPGIRSVTLSARKVSANS